MALKSTKATQRRNTKGPSNLSVPASFTAGPSLELKNTYDKGLQAEQWVLEHYLTKGCSLVQQRLKTPYAEVDLLLSRKDVFIMLEVKMIRSWDQGAHRLSYRQRQRLERAFQFLSNKLDKPLLFELVLVAGPKQIWSTSWEGIVSG